jgi:dUTP pyrophosphatase
MYVARMVDDAVLPTRKHALDAGMDIYAYGDHIIRPNTFKLISTGIVVKIPIGFYGQLFPKGKNNWLIGSGVVDYGYEGEIIVKVVNPYSYDIVIRHGDPVCQLVLISITTPPITEVDLDYLTGKSERGASGGIHMIETEPE